MGKTASRKPKAANTPSPWRFLDDPLKNRMRKNTLTNIVYSLIMLPVMFFLTPFILKFVGKEEYGIWALTGTILVFVELIGGIQTPSALSVMVPKYDPKKQHESINQIINTMFVFYLGSAAVLAVVYFFAEGRIISMFFKTEAGLIPVTRFVLGVSLYLFLLNFVMLGFGYLTGAFNIFYLTNIVHIWAAFIRAGLMVVFLFMGYGIKGIVAAQMGVLLAESAAILVVTKKVFPELKFGFSYFNAGKLKDLLTLSLKLVVTRAAVLVNYNADKLILGYLINPVMAAYYQIGANISKYISNVPEMMGMASLIPASSELKAKGRHDKINLLFDRVNKYIFFTAFLLASGILVFGREFVQLWLGEGYSDVYTVMVYLAFGYTAGLFGYTALQILNGLERVRQTMIISVITAALNLGLSFVLASKYGIKGALYGTSISITLGAAAMLALYRSLIGHMFNPVDVVLKPVLAALAAYFAVAYITLPAGWLMFFLKAAAFSAVYFAASIFLLRHFDSYDLDLVRRYIPFIRKG